MLASCSASLFGACWVELRRSPSLFEMAAESSRDLFTEPNHIVASLTIFHVAGSA